MTCESSDGGVTGGAPGFHNGQTAAYDVGGEGPDRPEADGAMSEARILGQGKLQGPAAFESWIKCRLH
jgi:hypothetical protein